MTSVMDHGTYSIIPEESEINQVNGNIVIAYCKILLFFQPVAEVEKVVEKPSTSKEQKKVSFAPVIATEIQDLYYDDNWSEENDEDAECVLANFEFEIMTDDEECDTHAVSTI